MSGPQGVRPTLGWTSSGTTVASYMSSRTLFGRPALRGGTARSGDHHRAPDVVESLEAIGTVVHRGMKSTGEWAVRNRDVLATVGAIAACATAPLLCGAATGVALGVRMQKRYQDAKTIGFRVLSGRL